MKSIDTLVHSINENVHNLSKYAQDHPVAIDHVHFDDHPVLRDKVETQNNIYGELKSEFMEYLRHAM